MITVKQITILVLLTISAWSSEFDKAVATYNKGNYVQALNAFYVLAKAGDAQAQYNVALIYEHGKGVKKDRAQAMEWYEKAAKSGNGPAAYNLGQIYCNLDNNSTQKFERAKRWYELAAQKGVAQAHNNLAALYLEGKGVEKNKITALEHFKKAAEMGSANAQINLGVLYAWGEDVPNDKMKAYINFKKALKAGKSEASQHLDKLCKESAWVCKN